ncbi:uncharacterized protein LOC122385775 [Amphibalanus amphitrite]|uniref:uncharacterized protein LOC122385775 n=1 Tax=Amphibalanus amphitrite TaxID=1232801 RepID=UPI001C8FFAE0|nr:uncharacterized protein LOC122385775 [Amphibalanus amphitrite]XP_043230203.1 uncharacterized protein LOC122385775 [Amphibalanus amphitrite]
MIKVGNQTNSQDPQAVNSRVFVGNLNTFQATKTDVERLFQRYGRIAGISMHKGFAFIQFTNPFDARSACMGEDARSIFGQVLDVNMVAEPKPAQTGRKRQQQQQQKHQQQQQQQQQNVIQTANDWYYAAAAANPFTAAAAVRLAAASPPNKRQRVLVPPHGTAASPGGSSSGQTPSPTPAPAGQHAPKLFCLDDLKTYSSPDILICGNCREMFGDVMDMLDHKRSYCKLRFACKCGEHTTTAKSSSRTSSSLVCALCKESFSSAWDLMVHFQTAHTVNIYRLGSPPKDADARSEAASSETSVRDAEVKDVTSPGSAVPNGTPTVTVETTNGSPDSLTSPALKVPAPDRLNGSAVAQRS